jgi:hypothetical protein
MLDLLWERIGTLRIERAVVKVAEPAAIVATRTAAPPKLWVEPALYTRSEALDLHEDPLQLQVRRTDALLPCPSTFPRGSSQPTTGCIGPDAHQSCARDGSVTAMQKSRPRPTRSLAGQAADGTGCPPPLTEGEGQ